MGVKVDANHGHPLFPAAFVFDRVKGTEGLGQDEFDLVTSMSSLVISEGSSLGLERAYAKREVEVRARGAKRVAKVESFTQYRRLPRPPPPPQFSVLCYVQLISADVTWWFILLLFKVVSFLLDILTNLASARPREVSGVGGLALLWAWWRRKAAKARKEKDDFLKVKELTYEKLSSSPGPLSKESLKSDVLHVLSPDSKRNRKKLEKAWRAVEAEVGGDGRVECVAGGGEERWEWTYTKSKRGESEDGSRGRSTRRGKLSKPVIA